MGSSDRPSAAERVNVPDARLTRSDLRDLGLERRAVDAVFRAVPVVATIRIDGPALSGEASAGKDGS